MEPTERQMKTLLAAAALARGGTVSIIPDDAEECVDNGWLEPVAVGVYRLTKAGQKVLSDRR